MHGLQLPSPLGAVRAPDGADEAAVNMAQRCPSSEASPEPAPAAGVDAPVVVDTKNPYRQHSVSPGGVFHGNPVVVGLSLVVTWAVVLAAVLDPDLFFTAAAESKRLIANNFTWLYVGGQNVWMFFIAYIYLTPAYRSLKFGKDDDIPEYNTVTWFVMMFGTAGSGTGLIFYGVGEPIYHLGYNRYLSRGYMSYDEVSQEAINLAFYHWGIHAWMCYTVVGICLGITVHRMGLPLSMRSCFYPILGDTIWGSMGDIVDALAIITTVFAVCASMGLGAIQINTGLQKLAPAMDKSVAAQVVVIALITLVASISAHAGLRKGVRVLSIISFAVMTTLLMCTLMVDDTEYLLNLFVQSIGHHMHRMIDLGFQTDAYEQLNMSVDGKSGPKVWMDWWTVFYWGWWVSWSPFVGIFIVKISKGRTVGELINASLTGPVLYTFLWFAIFGGAGQRMERSAVLDGCLGRCQFVANGVPFDDKHCKSSGAEGRRIWNHSYKPGRAVAAQDQARADLFLSRRPEGCAGIKQLSMLPLDEMWFEVLFQYKNVGPTMVVLSLVAMILSVVTTNDSGSIVLDIIGTNGGSTLGHRSIGHQLQKQAWSLNIGVMTIVMLIVGKSKALVALQTCIIALGLPNTLQTCVICYAVKLAFDMELHQDTLKHKTVSEGRFHRLERRDNGMGFWSQSLFRVFSIFDYAFSKALREPFPVEAPTMREVFVLWPAMICFPWYWIGVSYLMAEGNIQDHANVHLLSKWEPSNKVLFQAQIIAASAFLSFTLCIGLCLASTVEENFWVLGMACYFFFAAYLALVRNKVVRLYNISSDVGRNLITAVFFYPFGIAQMYAQLQRARPVARRYRASRAGKAGAVSETDESSAFGLSWQGSRHSGEGGVEGAAFESSTTSQTRPRGGFGPDRQTGTI